MLRPGGREEVGGGEEAPGVDLGDVRDAARRLLDVDAVRAARDRVERADRPDREVVDRGLVDRACDRRRRGLAARREVAVEVLDPLARLAGDELPSCHTLWYANSRPGSISDTMKSEACMPRSSIHHRIHASACRAGPHRERRAARRRRRAPAPRRVRAAASSASVTSTTLASATRRSRPRARSTPAPSHLFGEAQLVAGELEHVLGGQVGARADSSRAAPIAMHVGIGLRRARRRTTNARPRTRSLRCSRRHRRAGRRPARRRSTGAASRATRRHRRSGSRVRSGAARRSRSRRRSRPRRARGRWSRLSPRVG